MTILFLLAVPLAVDAFAAVVSGSDQGSLFARPAKLVPAVDFWTRVYTELDTGSGFIHDDRRLDVIYQTLYLNAEAPPAAQNAAIEKALDGYRNALLALAGGKRTGLTGREENALGPWGEGASAAELLAAAERLRFQRGQADRFQEGLQRSRHWRPHIRAVFRGQGLPLQLAALPHVESSYNPSARSKAGAVGLWQFMPATARRYLRVDELVDERLDPFRSTEAAAHLLRQNYSVLKHWPLAITAYNHGLSGVRRAVRETGTVDLGKIVEVYEGERFGFASRNFYAAFLAAMDVSEEPGRYFADAQLQEREPITVLMPAYLPVDVIVAAFGITKDQLRRLNPSLHHAVWNGTHFIPRDVALKLPGDWPGAAVREALRQLAQYFGFGSQKPYRSYEVHWGDSLSVIAQRHHTTVSDLVAMNGLTSVHDIHAGQVLRVPMGPVPEPLGAGAAAMLKDQLARGDFFETPGSAGDASFAAASSGEQPPGRETAAEVVDTTVPAADRCELAAPAATGAGVDGGAAEAEAMLAASPAAVQPDLAADPVDYGVGADGTIEIQIAETLGHYAEWLEMTSDALRGLNELDEGEPLIVGRRLKLDFSHATREGFQQSRIAFHKSRQLAYFRRNRISGVLEHRVETGDNLWLLAVQQYRIPLWLLRQYNPDIDVDTVLSPGGVIAVPLVKALSSEDGCVLGGGSPVSRAPTDELALRN